MVALIGVWYGGMELWYSMVWCGVDMVVESSSCCWSCFGQEEERSEYEL